MKKILIKISGEMLSTEEGFGIEFSKALELARALKNIKDEGYSVSAVIGGGNIFRGIHLEGAGLERSAADQMGMLSTMINGVALKNAFLRVGAKCRVFSAVDCPKIVESFQYENVLQSLQNQDLLLFVGGTGNPYFTTDTAAALRASEIGADMLVKVTKVDGVYDKDPKQGHAKKFETLTYSDYLSRQLKVMDMSAVTLCMNENIPILVYNMKWLGRKSLDDIMREKQGTLIQGH